MGFRKGIYTVQVGIFGFRESQFGVPGDVVTVLFQTFRVLHLCCKGLRP